MCHKFHVCVTVVDHLVNLREISEIVRMSIIKSLKSTSKLKEENIIFLDFYSTSDKI